MAFSEKSTINVFLPSNQTCKPGQHALGWNKDINNCSIYVIAAFVTEEYASRVDNCEDLLWSRVMGQVSDHVTVGEVGQLPFFVSDSQSVLPNKSQRTVFIYYNNGSNNPTYRLREFEEDGSPVNFSKHLQPDDFNDGLEFALAAINTVPFLMSSLSKFHGHHIFSPQTNSHMTEITFLKIILAGITLVTWGMKGLLKLFMLFITGCSTLPLFNRLNVLTVGRLIATRRNQYNYCVQDVKNRNDAGQQRIGQDAVGLVERQLVWLMGVPAGLKLNSALDQLLGEFFLYLIGIWSAYLRFVVGPLLYPIVFFMTLSSCLGMSVLLALLGDILSVMTFHIYCFYVFAAKMYSVQVYTLGSLWRLFTGKKWNVLRNRVDSCEYNVDQLFLGTLLFTVLFFLLPTVAMYYFVFCLLRLIVLSLHVVISITISVSTTLPIYGLLIRLLNPLQFPGGIKLELKTPLPSCLSSIHLLLKRQSCSWMSLWQWSGCPTLMQMVDIKNLVKLLLVGQLVYPWSWKEMNKV
ncbi:phosphatidylinositol N-acetylglucosaminyltransferase subunit Q-like isoform X1 [Corticium candelabrum]|uniref:phosphatidylinositol N-acetylglucosaminyltransferase subunit Q-like isoform X1 n=1 Tax=Corticium candelabrum TaxID=121492 RepID=UPI002E363E91|nr:phosphatidylinositol N-acetylglucosaminyltransferase subunit Q-like isoform X1 [Corticium candelabrum]